MVSALARRPPAPPPKKTNRFLALLPLVVILTMMAVAGGSLWVGAKLLIDPNSIVWLNRFLPRWTRIPIANPEALQTVAQIRAGLQQQDLIAGEFIRLQMPGQKSENVDLLLPVFEAMNPCPTAHTDSCQQIVELRIYRSTEPNQGKIRSSDYYWLVNQIPVAGPEESFVIAPLVNASSAKQGSTRPLPLFSVNSFDTQAPTTGIWLTLQGQFNLAGTTISYGQVLHYNPDRAHLSVLLPWTSPTGQGPVWKNITGNPTPELFLDQTVELEPQFKAYQVKPRKFLPNPVQLEPIALGEEVVTQTDYENAMTLARAGLWTPALALLQSARRKPNWSDAAQAQLDLIQIHAKATQQQADKSWASPSQQVLTSIIDGRWRKALQVYQASSNNRSEIASLLKNDSGRLWSRIMAALRVNPRQVEVQSWAALMLYARQGRAPAINWVRQQSGNSAETNRQIYQLLNQLDIVLPATESTNHASHGSQIIGSAAVLKSLNPRQWLRPSKELAPQSEQLKLAPDENWYEVQVTAFHDGKQWRRSPFSGIQISDFFPTDQLWRLLGLDNGAQIQILVWTSESEQETVSAVVKGLQIENGQLTLLASGNRPVGKATSNELPSPLAMTGGALSWLDPGGMSLLDLAQQDPQSSEPILRSFWQELQSSGQPVRGPVSQLNRLLQTGELNHWIVKQVDLTGDNQPEVIFSVQGAAIARPGEPPKPGRSRTIVFSRSGTVLYSELTQTPDQTVISLADLGDRGLPILLTDTSEGYRFIRWSKSKQRFE